MPPSGAPLGIGASIAEQPLEDHLGVVLHRKGRGRSLPRNRVPVSTTQVATTQARVLDHHLDRRQGRVLSDLPRSELVHGDAQTCLRAGLRVGAAQEGGGRAIVVGGRRSPTVRLRVAEIADDVHLAVKRFERLENLRQLEAGAVGRRRPLVHRRAVRHINAGEARPPFGRRLRQRRDCWKHRFEVWQRHRDAHAVQERAPRQMLPGDERHGWNSYGFLIFF